jgi:Zn-finger nucleic acid-binding protein
MNCPNCGAAMELSAAHGFYRCRYCGTFHFPDSVDDQGVRVLGPADNAVACPVCDVPLVLAMLETCQVHHCARCRGLLIPRSRFATIVGRRRSWAEGPPVVPIPPPKEALSRRLTCPTCGKHMSVDRYYGPGNVIMDGCPSCDTVWLDFGELKQIVDAPGDDRGTRDRSRLQD